ncbi:MAG: FlgD immunoglobulin-like domain containing protein [Candidatus Eisenbacteria bacterium]
MRHSVRYVAGWVGVFLLLAAPGWADFVGLNGDGIAGCDSADMAFDATGLVGSTRNIDLYFSDIVGNMGSYGCVFCVKDKSMVSNESFVYVDNGWTGSPMKLSDGPGWTIAVSDFITTAYPDYRCYLVQATDFTFLNPVTTFPFVLGTFSYQVAAEGCLGFVIDGANSAWLSSAFQSFLFDAPGETCDTSNCAAAGPPPLVIDSLSPGCPIPDAVIDFDYTADNTIQFTAVGGTPPYAWTQAGLPEGMNVDNDGFIVGTPTQAGGFGFTVIIDDAGSGHDELPCSLFVIEYGVQVELNTPPNRIVEPGDTLSHEFRVTNIGNTTTDFGYVIGSLHGSTFWLNHTGSTLAPLGAQSVTVVETVSVAPPCPPVGSALDSKTIFGAAVLALIPDVKRMENTPTAFDTVNVEVRFPGGVENLVDNYDRCDLPGNTVSFEYSFHNTGICLDTFDLSASDLDLPWVYRIVGSNPLILNGDQWGFVHLEVDIGDGLCLEPQRFQMTATGRNFGATVSDTVTACPLWYYFGTMTHPGDGFGEPGDPVEYCYTIENTGNCPALFILRFTSGWDTDPDMSPPQQYNVTLQPGGTDVFCLDHLIPGDAQANDMDELCAVLSVSAASGAKTRDVVLDTACVTTTVQVACEGGVTVAPQTNSLCKFPGETFDAMFDVTNTGTCAETFDLAAGVLFNDWSSSVAPTVTIPAGVTTPVAVSVTVSPDEGCGSGASVYLTATGQNYGAADSNAVSETVCTVLDGEVAEEDDGSGLPGDSVEYCFTIQNTGNCTAEFILDIAQVGIWQVIGPGEIYELMPGETADPCVRHVIPEDAQPGDSSPMCVRLLVSDTPPKRELLPVDSTCVTTSVTGGPCEAGVAVNSPGGPYMADPGLAVAVPFWVKNIGVDPDRYAMASFTNNGWASSIIGPDTTGVVAPGDSVLALVEVTVAPDALCDELGEVQFVALSLCDAQTFADDMNDVGVNAVFSGDATAFTEDTTGVSGQTIEYIYRITNTSNCPAYPLVGYSVSQPWSVMVEDPGDTAIAAGAHEDLTVTIMIPDSAEIDDEHLFELCVAMMSDPPPPPAKAENDFVFDCDTTITRVIGDGECVPYQSVLGLGAYETVSYVPPIWKVRVDVRNFGPGEARNVHLVMGEDIDWLNLSDAFVDYGSIGQGASSFGMAGDYFEMDLTGYPGGSFNVWFNATYTDSCQVPYQLRLDPTFLDPNENGAPAAVPGAFALHQNRPNPFNPTTEISFDLPESGFAELTIFNAAGQMVKKLHTGQLSSGTHTFVWDGQNERVIDAPSGTYFYSLGANGKVETKRMVLIR